MTTLRWYLLGLLALFGVYVTLEYYRPRPIDWTPTLANKDKIPYGTYALYDVLPALLGTDSLENVRLPIYNQFYDHDDPSLSEDAESAQTDTTQTDVTQTDTAQTDTTQATQATASAADTVDTGHPVAEEVVSASPDSTAVAATDSTAATDEDEEEDYVDPVASRRASYVFVAPGFTSTDLETNALKRFVEAGNDVFIATDEFASGSPLRRRRTLADELGVTIGQASSAMPDPRNPQRVDSAQFRFVNPALSGAALRLPAYQSSSYFEVKPGHAGTTLATSQQGRAVLVRLTYGRGHFYLCSLPLAFTNYYVLRPSSRRFALAALSYLPTGRPVWWDEYQKQGRSGEQSVLGLVFSHEALRWAYYLLTVTVLLLVLVKARRRQRVIPLLKPLPNTTLLFTRTVATLYRQGRNHQRIADKRVALFLDYLRTRFQEPTPDLGDAAFRERLSERAGVPHARVDELLRYVNFARTAPVVNDAELLKLSRAISAFRREAR